MSAVDREGVRPSRDCREAMLAEPQEDEGERLVNRLASD